MNFLGILLLRELHLSKLMLLEASDFFSSSSSYLALSNFLKAMKLSLLASLDRFFFIGPGNLGAGISLFSNLFETSLYSLISSSRFRLSSES